MSVTVIVPTYNEAPNVEELVRRVNSVADSRSCELLFVDDSTDDTPDVIRRAAEQSSVPVRLIHREDPVGGLSGAVIAGITSSASDWCLVMDGDLQHPPEMIPVLLETGNETGADVVVASRHVSGGSNEGLSGWTRKFVSNGSIAATRAMFPNRLRNCTDPMTGFFAVRRTAIDVDALQPRGFKILLEILTRHRLRWWRSRSSSVNATPASRRPTSPRACASSRSSRRCASAACRPSQSSAPSGPW